MFYTLRFKPELIAEYAGNYEYSVGEVDLAQYAHEIQARGFLTKTDLERVAKWKSPRSAGHISKNSEEYVQAVTAMALQTDNEQLRIESLTLLDGVGLPTASVVLHFYHGDRYPILDSRAIWSLSLDDSEKDSFEFWWNYTVICRALATENHIDMRTLDKALWQYSKENQESE
ncbi:MAG TPA: hypothetical protein DCG32_05760 [Sphaerochaeta sp.]|jgi:hypothetical protein|nr:hypothetical protein [Sphaerochaeta sp.]